MSPNMDSDFVLHNANSVLLETTLPSKDETRSFLFTNPVETLIAYNLNDLEKILKKINSFLEKDLYLAGYLSYEAGYLFEETFRNQMKETEFEFPLAWFGVFEKPRITLQTYATTNTRLQLESFRINSLSMSLNEEEYKNKVHTILDYIKKGETYQVNFTMRVNFDFEGSPSHLYESLKKNQPVPYSAIINDGERQILCLSPELFFRRTGDTLIARPMKGTSERGKSRLDDIRLGELLKSDPKTRAENSMIVDLIRNDFGKISKLGTVQVEKLMQIEEYETLFQMTSTVKSILKKDIDYFQLFKAIFPGGSITGAPKYRTMQIIKELESSNREVYTGAIGFISKEEATFNIPIRTVQLKNNKGIMGVGSGIVWDSLPKKEYEECILKQRFLYNTISFRLIESILYKNGKYVLLNLHLKRLESSAFFFGFTFNENKIINSLEQLRQTALTHNSIRIKVRLELCRNGEIILEYSNIQKEKLKQGRLGLSSIKISQTNIFQSHKTTIRKIYTDEYKRATEENLIDFFFLNEKEEVVETSIYNIIIAKDKSLFTPPISSGALPGVMREYLIKKGKIKEKTLTISDLKTADKIYICNSVRGIMRVILE
jgi:para-aminobenzoate synthetase/4-amino-4-deoxychorismate lyase